ncbi:MAG TPA: dehydrogenase [Planctomycetales bacterium]|nr:dehydrogenase [Planctomycetales bacterium]
MTLPLLLISAFGLGAAPNPNIVEADPRTPADEAKSFHLPPGFEIQLVASDPDIHKPLNLEFDDRGRLWVSETVEYPFPLGADGKLKGQDAVKILEDFGPDGRARKITTFADKLDIPIGVLPLLTTKPQDALIYSIPNIWRMRDADGDGKADERTPLYTKYGFKDTHGMTNNFTWGFDGWVYACHGFSNESTVKGGDERNITMQSGNVYRLRPDGSHLEYFLHGEVNPFGLAFDPLGNLYTCDCETKPIWQLLRGGYYPSFGKPDDGLGFAPTMIERYTDSSAIAGVAFYAADSFPAAHRDSAYVGDVVTNRVNEFRLTWHGSTPHAVKQDFLLSDDRWFRPVHVKLGPDGALYIADFYNRIIGHYEVPLDHPGRDHERGRIWRIVYRGPDGKGPTQLAPRADWTTAPVDELLKDLGHPNLAVRIKATNELAARGGKDAVAAVLGVMNRTDKPEAGDIWRRMHGLYVLERVGALDDATLGAAAKDKEFGVRVHAQRILSERAKWTDELHALALAGLKDADANVQRAAADAVGRHPAADNLRPLLDLYEAAPAEDTHLLYVVRMALRDQLLPANVWNAIPLKVWTERDARAIADVSLGAPTPEAAAFLLKHLGQDPQRRDFLTRAVHHIARYGSPDVAKTVTAFARGQHPADFGLQFELFQAVRNGGQERGAALDDAARAWADDLTNKLLASKSPQEVKSGTELVAALKMESQESKVVDVATNKAIPREGREAAMAALTALNAGRNAGVLGKVLTDADNAIELREGAAKLLAQANQPETQAQLLQALPAAPARLQTAIAAGLAGSPAGAAKLLDAVEAGKASARLLQERAVEAPLTASNIPDVKNRLAKLTKGLPPADQKIQELIAARHKSFQEAKADAEAGAKVFEKNCAICHTIANKGAKVGPQLDGVGIRGLDRLLEDVLDPNRNVDQAFRMTILNLTDGKVVRGLLLRQVGAVLVMADDKGKEVRVPIADVDERSTSQQSPMPATFAEQVSQADFHNLMAFLLKQTAAPATKPPG